MLQFGTLVLVHLLFIYFFYIVQIFSFFNTDRYVTEHLTFYFTQRNDQKPPEGQDCVDRRWSCSSGGSFKNISCYKYQHNLHATCFSVKKQRKGQRSRGKH